MAPAKKSPAKKTPAKKASAKNASARSDGEEAADAIGSTRTAPKRDFGVTSEPAGSVAPTPDGHRFVVQRHRARRLHYDLRLEADGVLVSWAVPKGPTLDPNGEAHGRARRGPSARVLRLRGRHPARASTAAATSSCGTGARGRLADGTDPVAAVEAGDLHFDLDGEKLRGRFVLVRRGGADAKEQWLLLHKHDDDAVAGWDPEDHPRSVKTGRTNDEVKAAPAASWSSTCALGRHRRPTSSPPSTRSASRANGSSASTR